jgi:hypothetical protein
MTVTITKSTRCRHSSKLRSRKFNQRITSLQVIHKSMRQATWQPLIPAILQPQRCSNLQIHNVGVVKADLLHLERSIMTTDLHIHVSWPGTNCAESNLHRDLVHRGELHSPPSYEHGYLLVIHFRQPGLEPSPWRNALVLCRYYRSILLHMTVHRQVLLLSLLL